MTFIEKTEPAAIQLRWFKNGLRAFSDRSEPLYKRILRIALALLPLVAIVAVVVLFIFRDGTKSPSSPANTPVRTGTP